jgi:flagellar FliJ protein
LQELARKECDQAASRMGHAQRRAADAEKKLQLLEGYRADYETRQRSLERTDVLALSNLHAFVAKLRAAIDRQQREVQTACAESIAAHAEWMQARQRLKSLEVLLERREAAARAHAARLQQKQQDEMAARLARAALRAVG